MAVTTYDHAMTTDQRCERCGAQAWVEVLLSGGASLLFCAHDYAAHEDKLTAKEGVVISDHRPALYAQEVTPATA